MAEIVAAPPVSDPERRRVEQINVLGCVLPGALLAGLHLGLAAALGADRPPDAYPVAVLAYTLALGAWVVNSGRSLGYGGDPRQLEFKGRAGYRGARLAVPAMSAAAFGLVLSPVWEAGAYVLAVAGFAGAVLGVAAGAVGRFPVFSPRPLREGWPETGTGPLPHLYPGFVEHVFWLRRMRARLFGGEPTRPLVRLDGGRSEA